LLLLEGPLILLLQLLLLLQLALSTIALFLLEGPYLLHLENFYQPMSACKRQGEALGAKGTAGAEGADVHIGVRHIRIAGAG
jgi:hypothetical protein